MDPRNKDRDSGFLFCYQLNADRNFRSESLPLNNNHSAFNRQAAHFLRVLSDGASHGSFLDGVAGIARGVESNYDDFAVLLSSGNGFDCAQGHKIIASEDAGDVRVRLKDILEDVIAL